jgi:hypothetical protein
VVVFATFLADLHSGVDLPSAWMHTPTATAAAFDRTADDLRVETTPPTAPAPRLRLLDGSTAVVEAVPQGPPRKRAREFVAAFEAFYPSTNARRSASKRSGASKKGECPTSAYISSRAFGNRSACFSAAAGLTTGSAAPWINSTGVSTPDSVASCSTVQS